VQSASPSSSSFLPRLGVIVPGPALVGDWALITRWVAHNNTQLLLVSRCFKSRFLKNKNP
jgi:hypothetical protein